MPEFNYQRHEIRRVLDAGTHDNEDWFRLQVSGKVTSHHLNVTAAQVTTMCQVLIDDGAALRKLLADWFEGQLTGISEFGHSQDWQPLIDDAKVRHATFGIPWSDTFVPEYIREILAIE